MITKSLRRVGFIVFVNLNHSVPKNCIIIKRNGGDVVISEKVTAGFERPQVPQDEWAKELYAKYELGSTPSLEEIEPKALELLSSPFTFIEAAELVLARRVDAKEKEIAGIFVTKASPREKFDMLFKQKIVEDLQAKRIS